MWHIKSLLVLVCFFFVASANAGAWRHQEVKDEMRGTVAKSAFLTTKALNDPSVSLTMHLVDKGDKAQGIVFNLSGDSAACGDEICDVPVRFGAGSVASERMSVSKDGKTVIPNKSSAFAGSVSLSKELFIELPLVNGGRTQFKYEIDGPTFERVKNPSFSLMGISLGGSSSALSSEFKRVESSSIDCREAKNVSNAIPGVVLSSARMCFYNDMLYLVFIDSNSKAESAAIAKYLTATFGEKDPESIFPSWPKDTGKVIDLYTAGAAFWPDSKNKAQGRYMVFDESISSLVPK